MKTQIGKMKINIIGGSGVMGRVHKELFEKAGHKVIISGRDSTPSIEEATRESDLTIISVPISATEEVIKKVAPYAKAIMDFTGLKVFSMKVMLGNSGKNCEVCGLHPLYGNVESVRGRTVIVCETERTGEKCREIIKIFEKAGAKIKKMNPEEHDYLVATAMQSARVLTLESYGIFLHDKKINVQDLYDVSSPPTKILLDLMARQADGKNDDLYREMKKFNPFWEKASEDLIESMKKAIDSDDNSEKIREFFGSELRGAQERARKIIEG